jgi:hypothetical protein
MFSKTIRNVFAVAGVLAFSAAASAQSVETRDPNSGEMTAEERQMNTPPPRLRVFKTDARLGDVQTNAVTPAADISTGTFGANTGGGSYTFANGALFYDTNLNSPNVFGFNYQKSRGTALARTIVQNGDNTGFFGFYGWDGDSYELSSLIRAQIDGTPGAGDMPGRILFLTSNDGAASPAERMRITSTGNVGIGTSTPTFKLHVVGNTHIAGTLTGTSIAATYQDVAEWVPATTELEPGDVVVLNTEKNNEVMVAGEAYSTHVAGVVSVQPGLTLGVPADNKEMVATTGRVQVRVDATKNPIKVGDLLVTSGKAGVAMKSEPMDINGRAFHQPGTIIGKALEPLASGEGTILVLLSLQ